MKIYLVATIKDIDSLESRTVGCAETLEEAQRWVENNVCDIFEYYYRYAVIEDVGPGIYAATEATSIWYEWIDGKYTQIEKPKELEHVICFTIG